MAEFAVQVSDTLREYLKEICNVLQDTESDADPEVVITSALEEIDGKEVKVATDVECSRILETLIQAAPTELLLQLAERIATREALFTVACNPFGSHVLEKLLLQLQHALRGDDPENALRIVDGMVNLVKVDLIDYITHKFATFFARRLLQLLTGQLSAAALDGGAEKKDIADKVKLIQKNSENSGLVDGSGIGANQAEELPCPEFKEHLHSLQQEVCGHGFDSATLMSLQRSTYASPFLQALLRAVADKAQSATLICHMLGAPPEPTEQPAAALANLDSAAVVAQMKHKTASHMIEAIFLCCPPKLYDPVFKCIASSFPALCVNPIANYAAQSLIAAAPASRYVGDVFHTLKGSLEDCLLRGRSGVACLLVAACAAWRAECEDCCSAVLEVFPDGVVQGLAMLGQDQTLPEVIETAHTVRRPPRLSVNGCIILKSMLSMPQSACRAVTDAIVAMDSAAVEFVAADPSGARVLETLLKGSAPKPVKRKLVGLLQGSYVKLAKLGAASRLVESLFMWCDVSDKRLIAQPLADHLTEVKASKFGGPLCQAFQLDLFKSGVEEWCKRMQSSIKIKAQYQKLFADSIAKESKAKRKSKKRKGREDQEGAGVVGQDPTAAPIAKPPAQSDRPVAAVGEGVGLKETQSEMGELVSKKSKKRKQKSADSPGHTNTDAAAELQQHVDVAEVQKEKKGRGDKSSREFGRKDNKQGKRGHLGDAEDSMKPATDVKSVVGEVMAELAIGSNCFSGSKSRKGKYGGAKKAKRVDSKEECEGNGGKRSRVEESSDTVKQSVADVAVVAKKRGKKGRDKVMKRGKVEK